MNADEDKFIKLIDSIRQERILTHGQKLKANRVAIFGTEWWSDMSEVSVINLTEKWRRR